MAVDIRSMRGFVAVASAGSISKAAEHLHIAQPALSLQIKNIEEELGTQLFERSPKGVTPTAAGQRFLTHAIDILKRVEVAYEDVRDAVSEPTGSVTLGLSQSMAKILTVSLVSEILRRWPKIRFQMIEVSTGYIPEYLINGRIDLGLTFGMDEGPGLRYTHLVDEELVFVTSKSQCMEALGSNTTKEEIRLEEMCCFRMILPTVAHSLRNCIDHFLAVQHITLPIVAEVSTIPQLIDLAAREVGSSILSYGSVASDYSAGRLQVMRISNERLTRPVYLCRSTAAPLSIATALVQELIKNTAAQLIQSGEWPTSYIPVRD